MKVCRKCNVEKPLSAFHPNKTCSQGVVGTCRDCTCEHKKQWYSDNRKERQERVNTLNREKKQYWIEAFGGRCLDCQGVFQPCVYQFHHVDGTKEVNPSKAMTWTFERAKEEMAKCVMLCANCHMVRHHGEEDGI